MHETDSEQNEFNWDCSQVAELEFVSKRNPIHNIAPAVYSAACAAQSRVFERVFPSAAQFLQQVIADLRIRLTVPQQLARVSAQSFAEKSFAEFQKFFSGLLQDDGYPEQAVPTAAHALATRAMLTRAFHDPDSAVAYVRDKITEVAQTLPRTGKDMECGRNRGDVLDPFILAATQYLLYQGEFDSAISATVSHKALMIIEGLMGHLHEDVIGRMRGNVRVPEPGGEEKERFDLHTNPFPGADILQPPSASGQKLRLHQVKSKTGSAKGGDGKRLGDQLQFLADHYDAEIYYDALVGNTLVGHRSRAGVERAAPSVAVLVGQAAFTRLTGSAHGASLLLRLYQESFKAAAAQSGYAISEVTLNVVAYFKEQADKAGEGFLETILDMSTGGDPADQDNRLDRNRT
jgi:hypothetical protein